MSKNLTTNAIAQFADIVHHEYAGEGMLRKTSRVRTGITGTTFQFQKMGKGIATQRIPQTKVVPMNIAHTNAVATIVNWNAPEFTDIFDQQKVNYDERRELGHTIAGAIGRREDQLIIDALDAASTTLTVSNDIGGTDTGMNTAKLRRAKGLLDNQGVKGKDRWAVLSTRALEDLLGDSDADTFDKNVIKPLFDGDINRWLGFNFVFIETRTEGGLTITSDDRQIFCYHRSAIGLAIGIDFRVEVNYIADMTSWLANGLYAAGAVAIDATGIVEITSREG